MLDHERLNTKDVKNCLDLFYSEEERKNISYECNTSNEVLKILKKIDISNKEDITPEVLDKATKVIININKYRHSENKSPLDYHSALSKPSENLVFLDYIFKIAEDNNLTYEETLERFIKKSPLSTEESALKGHNYKITNFRLPLNKEYDSVEPKELKEAKVKEITRRYLDFLLK